jgi:DNA-binding ferritin-like protein
MNREQAVEKMRSQLEKWSRDIDALAARASQYADQGHQEYIDSLKDLRIKKENARAELERMRNASDESFDEVQRTVEQGWQKVRETFDKTLARYH